MSDACAAELDQLLSEPRSAACQRAARAFDEQAAGGNKVILFGAGGLGRRVAAALAQTGLTPIAFADNNSALWGKTVEGLPVMAPAEACRRHGRDATFIVSIWRAGGTHRFGNTRRQLRDLGAAHIAHAGHLFWKFPQLYLPYYAMDLPQHVLDRSERVRFAFATLADDVSRRHFLEQLRWRLHLDFDGLSSPGAEPQYFPAGLFRWHDDEQFLDVGAYDGDTLRDIQLRYDGRFGRVVALEPDPLNYQKLVATVAQLPEVVRARVETHAVAVADAPGRIRIDPTGLPSSVTGTGSVEVECVTLDQLADTRGLRPSYIKMDIEGAELAALRGGWQVIQRHRPILAVCAYHVQDHLWEVPLALRALNPDYAIHLRPHNEEGWDLVAYAVPPERKGDL